MELPGYYSVTKSISSIGAFLCRFFIFQPRKARDGLKHHEKIKGYDEKNLTNFFFDFLCVLRCLGDIKQKGAFFPPPLGLLGGADHILQNSAWLLK